MRTVLSNFEKINLVWSLTRLYDLLHARLCMQLHLFLSFSVAYAIPLPNYVEHTFALNEFLAKQNENLLAIESQ